MAGQGISTIQLDEQLDKRKMTDTIQRQNIDSIIHQTVIFAKTMFFIYMHNMNTITANRKGILKIQYHLKASSLLRGKWKSTALLSSPSCALEEMTMNFHTHIHPPPPPLCGIMNCRFCDTDFYLCEILRSNNVIFSLHRTNRSDCSPTQLHLSLCNTCIPKEQHCQL